MANLVANRIGSVDDVLRTFGFQDEPVEQYEPPDAGYEEYLRYRADRDFPLDDIFDDEIEDECFDDDGLLTEDPYDPLWDF